MAGVPMQLLPYLLSINRGLQRDTTVSLVVSRELLLLAACQYEPYIWNNSSVLEYLHWFGQTKKALYARTLVLFPL